MDLYPPRLFVGAVLVVGHTDVVPLVVLAGLVHLEPPGHLVLLGATAGHHRDSHVVPRQTVGLVVSSLEQPADVRDGEPRGLTHQDHLVTSNVSNAVWSGQNAWSSFTGSGVLHFEVTPFRILSLSHLADAGVGDVIGTTECVLVITDTDPDVPVLVHLTGEVVPAGRVLVASPGDVTDLALGLCAYLATFTPVARDSSLAGLVLLLRTGAAITGSAIRWSIFLSHGETKESQETRNEHYSLHSVAADEVLTTFPPLPKI